MNILVAGLIGCGKTSAGKILARKLNYSLVELDEKALEISGFNSTEEVFAFKKSFFRESEIEASRSLSFRNNQIIVCGGGFIENKINIDFFKESDNKTLMVFLKTNAESIFKRLSKHKVKYKLSGLQTLEKIRRLIEEREFLYLQLADIVVVTDRLSLKQTTQKIIKALNLQS